MSITAYQADRIFTGNELLYHHIIIVKDKLIIDIADAVETDVESTVINFGNALIAPAFIDLQLYGAYARLLSAYPDAISVKALYDYSKAGGCSHCMPTIATNTYKVIFKCIDAVKSYWDTGGQGILGLHVEGPWISSEKRGAHNIDWIFSPTVTLVKELLEYGKDVIKMITLAPEVCNNVIIDLIHSYNIVVSAGHTNATYNEATSSFNKIKTATHLYNAMSALQHRKPGMVGAVMDHPTVCCSIVPDGYHVSYPAIRIAKKVMGERLFAITDAVTETHEGFYQHISEGDKYTANGILSGSALTMNKCVKNFIKHCAINIEEALRMCSMYPAKVINKDDELGLIAENRKANFVVLDNAFNVIETIVR